MHFERKESLIWWNIFLPLFVSLLMISPAFSRHTEEKQLAPISEMVHLVRNSSVASSPAGMVPESKPAEQQWDLLSDAVKKAIQAGKIPGAVILIGHQGKIIYRRAFGFRALKPMKLSMTIDTIFDLASLTKVVATSTAVAQLVEAGKLSLQDPVAKHWPEFGSNGKQAVTMLDLLTH